MTGLYYEGGASGNEGGGASGDAETYSPPVVPKLSLELVEYLFNQRKELVDSMINLSCNGSQLHDLVEFRICYADLQNQVRQLDLLLSNSLE